MKTMVVFDSVFGNTEKVAREVAGALGAYGEVILARVGETRPEQMVGLDLLLVGSPTRAFQPTLEIKKWVRAIPQGALNGVRVASFDTRVDITAVNSTVLTALVKVFGYAAEPIAAGLKRKGGTAAGSPGAFIVLDKEGPLKDGELERAAAWAQAIGLGYN
jgi:flavodoxin